MATAAPSRRRPFGRWWPSTSTAPSPAATASCASCAWRAGRRGFAWPWRRLAPALARYLIDRDRGRLKAAMVGDSWPGNAREALEAEAQRFAAERAMAAAAARRADVLARWQGADARLVIVTASPEILVAPFARGLGAETADRHAAGVRRGRAHRRARREPTAAGAEKVRGCGSVRRGCPAGGRLWRQRRRHARCWPWPREGHEGLRAEAMRHARRRGSGPARAAAERVCARSPRSGRRRAASSI